MGLAQVPSKRAAGQAGAQHHGIREEATMPAKKVRIYGKDT
jgi:hypothetical protein